MRVVWVSGRRGLNAGPGVEVIAASSLQAALRTLAVPSALPSVLVLDSGPVPELSGTSFAVMLLADSAEAVLPWIGCGRSFDAFIGTQDPEAFQARLTALGGHERARRSLLEASVSQDVRFRAFTDAVPHAMWATDAAGNVLYRNRHVREFTGILVGEAESYLEWIHPDDRALLVFAWKTAVEQGTPMEIQYRMRRHDGVHRWHLLRGIPERDAEGKLLGWVLTATDIEGPRRDVELERLLADMTDLFSTSTEAEPGLRQLARSTLPVLADLCVVFVLSEDGVSVNVLAEHADPEVARELEKDLNGSPLEGAPFAAMREVIRGGAVSMQVDIPARDMLRSYSSGAVAERLGKVETLSVLRVPLASRTRRRGAIAYVREGSGRAFEPNEVRVATELARRAAAALEYAELYRAEQNAVRARDEFLSVASHELRTPLTPLALKLERLERDAREHPHDTLAARNVGRHVDVALRQVGRLTDLVVKLLDVSRIQAKRLQLHPQETDFALLIRHALATFEQELALAGCIVVADIPESMSGAWDRGRLEQVFSNLLTNAIKYGPHEPIEIRLRQENGEAVLVVEDHGIGIGPENLKRIFGRFERAVSEHHYGGLGLGLYIAGEVVKDMGGNISVESVLGQGSAFTVRVPLSPPPGPSL